MTRWLCQRLKYLLIGAMAILHLAPFASNAQTVSIARQTSLYSDRYLDSQVIQAIGAGQVVDVLRFEGGWVQIKTKQHVGWVRPMFLSGQGATKAQAAQLEAGRSSKLHKVSTTGIRSIARSSRHALIIGVGEYSAAGITDLLGVKHDIASATSIAEAMGVPKENITYLRDKQATGEGIRRALSEIDQRTHPGDRVFVYYSGHGTRWIDASFDPNSCTEGLLASDGQALTNREISALLQPVATKADKLMVFYDACHSGGIAQQPLTTRSLASNKSVFVPKFSSQVSPDLCAKPSNMRTRSLSRELGNVGAVPENTVFIAASRPDEVSFDDPQSGGLATVAWRDCLLGGATDVDGSGALSVAEMTQCAQTALNVRLGDQPDILGQKMTVGGNREFVPAFFTPALRPSVAESAAIADQEAKRQALLVQQQAETARLKAEQEALEKVELLKQEERARQLAEAECSSQALMAQQQAETARLKAEQEALEKAELLKQEERTGEMAQVVKELSKVQASAFPPFVQNLTAVSEMDPVVPEIVARPLKPADLLKHIHQQRDGTRSLTVSANRKVLRIDKDPLELTVKTQSDGYLYIALAGSDQESLYLLFPNRIDGDNFVKANQEIKLPRRSWRIVAGGPKGVDTVLVIVTDSPRDLTQLEGESVGPFTMPLMSLEGKSQLQLLINQSGNADQVACQVGGKTRNLKVQLVCSDSYASELIEFEER